MEIHETPLPGVGIRYDFTTREGRQMGVVVHNTGRRELVTYDQDDVDSAREMIALNDEEADTLAEILGAARITGPLEDLQIQVYGLTIDWLRVYDKSPFVGRPLGDTQARTKTGSSIVATIRGDDAFPSPTPDFVFELNDVLVVVGTPLGVNQLREILAGNA